MPVTTDFDEFLRLVESGAETVYPEDSPRSAVRAIIPLIIGSVVTLILLFSLTGLSVSLSPYVYLGVGFAPIILGFLITSLSLSRFSADIKQHGVRGLTRMQLSQSIYFLDMLLDGRADNGFLFKKPK